MFRRMGVAVCTAGLLAVVAGTLMADSKHARVLMKDDCDPTTFNQAVGPGTCVGNGETTFQQFIAELTAERTVDDWEFDPDGLHVRSQSSVTARNVGGETHTFTEVKQFGGGIVPPLNDLSGNPVPAPECLTPEIIGPTFTPPGGTVASNALAPGTHRFQCCIHPWMRTTVEVGADHHH
jgi:plastocyanin